tara:strand:+ start:30086 stop:30409 length:324 start_codon:yes stop_codon:yes gene_type:complete
MSNELNNAQDYILEKLPLMTGTVLPLSVHAIASISMVKLEEMLNDYSAIKTAQLEADKVELVNGLEYASSLLIECAENGNYPKSAMAQNGGVGFQPITALIQKHAAK